MSRARRAQNYPGGHFTLASQHNHAVADQTLAASILLVTFGRALCPTSAR
jgi:hypothetical protein